MSEIKERKYLLAFRVGILLLILSAGVNGVFAACWVKNKKEESKDLISSSARLSMTPEEEKTAYAQDYYEKKLRQLFTAEELNAMAQKQWSYILTVNGRQFTGNTIYIENTSNVRVVLAEVAVTEDLLPDAILKQGSLWRSEENKKLSDYMMLYTSEPYEVRCEEEAAHTKYTYNFKELQKGTVITLQLDSLLKEKLDSKDHIKSNRVQIVVR